MSVLMLVTLIIPWFMVCVYYNLNRFACIGVERNEWIKQTFVKGDVDKTDIELSHLLANYLQTTRYSEFKDLNIFYSKGLLRYREAIYEAMGTTSQVKYTKLSKIIDTTVVKFRKVSFYVLWFWTVVATTMSGCFIYIEFIR